MLCQLCGESLEEFPEYFLVQDQSQTIVKDYICPECGSTLTIEADPVFNFYKSTWVQG